MFKIKRSSHRNLNNKDILTDSQHNIPNAPYSQKFRRPPTAKSRQKQHNQIDEIQTYSEKSLEIRHEVRTAENRLTERSNTEAQIRNICCNELKDKCRRLGDLKQSLIAKILQKAIVLGYQAQESRYKRLEQMIESQIDKIIKKKQCNIKYEDSLCKIQNMLDDRINKLLTLR